MAPPRRKVRPLAAKGGKKAPPGKKPPVANRDRSSSSGSYSGSSSRSGSDDGSSSYSGGSDEDDPRDYKRGGYHPVTPYQLYSARYRVLSKLGAGAFSTVWLCMDEKDQKPEEPELVAMKVCKSKKSVTEQALDEVLLLERLQEGGTSSPHVVEMRGHFWHSGPHGRHKCMVFEVMGENLLALVKYYDYNGLPTPMVRRLARHTLTGLEYIHSRGVIHTDVKLENVLIKRHDLESLISEAQQSHKSFMAQKSGMVTLSKNQKKKAKKKEKAKAAAGEAEKKDSDAEDVGAADAAAADAAEAEKAAAAALGRPVPPVRQRERFQSMGLDHVSAKLADFGNGCRSNNKVTDDIQTRQYRSPEVIIGADWDETADVWSAACMFFELITGDFLFDPRTGDDWSRDEDHLALMIELIGDLPPKDNALSGKYSRDFFLNSGKLKHIKSLKFWALKDVLMQKYSVSEEDAQEISDFLMPMLEWLPSKRQSAADALKNRWVQPEAEAADQVRYEAARAKAAEEEAEADAAGAKSELADAKTEGSDGAAEAEAEAGGKQDAPAARGAEEGASVLDASSPERKGAADAEPGNSEAGKPDSGGVLNQDDILVELQDGEAAADAPSKAPEPAEAAQVPEAAEPERDPENEEPNKAAGAPAAGAAAKNKKKNKKGKK